MIENYLKWIEKFATPSFAKELHENNHIKRTLFRFIFECAERIALYLSRQSLFFAVTTRDGYDGTMELRVQITSQPANNFGQQM